MSGPTGTAQGGRTIAVLVAGTAGAVLFTEVALTRLLSVLLFYHYSFLAVSIALFGLAWGGLIAARRPLGDDMAAFAQLARRRLIGAAVALLAAMLLLATIPSAGPDGWRALGLAALGSIPLMMLGEVLARALALGRTRIHRLYAMDLVASAGSALLAIPLLQLVQGPVALAIPALMAMLLAHAVSTGVRRVTLLASVAIASLVVAAASSAGPLLELTDRYSGTLVLERWNAYSRVRVLDSKRGRELVIDRTAASSIPRVLRGDDGEPPRVEPTWASEYADVTYSLGRPSRRVAVIGVGGGSDLLAALAAGAGEIVGFELNGNIVKLLSTTLSNHTAVALRPEVRLVRDEARHALHGSAERYDVIRISLIDTWAATAAGGFVLSENGLYTVEAWRLFVQRLTDSGVLSVTRWHLPNAPAEAERLIGLAATALDEESLPARDRIVALALPSTLNEPIGGRVETITTLVSRRPFSQAEVARVAAFAQARGGTLLLAPGHAPAPEAVHWPALLSSGSRGRYVSASAWAIDPPRDNRPFFFLQLRPRDVFRLRTEMFGPVTQITMGGVKVLVGSALLALMGAFVLLWQTSLLRRRVRAATGVNESNLSVPGQIYFALLGLAYMAVQLALHQRLAIVLGHPTPTLALVVAAMLLGSGAGSWLAGSRRRPSPAVVVAAPAAAVTLLVLFFPYIGELSAAPGLWLTGAGAGMLSLSVGAALGVALPTGMRVFATSERKVAEAWAINGAFSVAGATLAALAGLVLGSRGLVLLAFPCYFAAFAITVMEARRPTLPAGTWSAESARQESATLLA